MHKATPVSLAQQLHANFLEFSCGAVIADSERWMSCSLIVYPYGMDIACILREIDAEIEKLEQIRKIVEGLSQPIQVKVEPRKRQPKQKETEIAAAPEPEPVLVVLPPKVKREYHPRVRVFQEAPKALTSAVPSRPVFVPKAVTAIHPEPEPTSEPTSQELDTEMLEAALRQNLFGSRLHAVPV